MLEYKDNLAIKRREYSKIFSGTHQDRGYENIFLSFSASTREILFQPDQVTYFHYSNFAPTIDIHQADLSEDGAIAGTTPSRSDRIYKKLADYNKYTGWGNPSIQTGTWLCAWLSGNADNMPIWYDRYFDPGQTTTAIALTSVDDMFVFSSNDEFLNFNDYSVTPIIYDVQSTLTFEPGSLYMYYHFGDSANETIVNSLSGNVQLDIRDWVTDLSLNDSKGYLTSQGSILPDTIIERDAIALSLSGLPNGEFKIPFSTSYNPTDEITVSCWVKAADWINIQGNQIFGRSFRGGWGLSFDTDAFNPLMTIFESVSSHIVIGNNLGKFTQDKAMDPKHLSNLTLSNVAISNDLYIWILSNGVSKALYKMDYNGDIVSSINYDSGADLTDLAIDRLNRIWVLDHATANLYRYDLTTPTLSANVIPLSDVTHTKMAFSRFALHSDTPLTRNCEGVVIDNNNNIWEVINSGMLELTKNLVVVDAVPITNFNTIKLDPQGNIWILHNTNQFVKLAPLTSTVTLSGSIGTSSVSGSREIGFTKEFINNEYVPFMWVLSGPERFLYKMDLNANILDTIDLTNTLDFQRYGARLPEDIQFAIKGDFTGSDWEIRNPQLALKSINFNISFIKPTNEIVKVKLPFDLKKLGNNQWHMFTFTFNNRTGKLAWYNNAIQEKTNLIILSQGDTRAVDLIGAKLHWQYDNDLIFGGNSGRFTNLDEELQTVQFHFNGSLAEPLIYNKELRFSDIYHIFKKKYITKTFIWNSPVEKQVFIEEIERFFKHKLPGSKSSFYNINLIGLNITDPSIQAAIEDIIRSTVTKVSPVHTTLLNIKWK